MWVARIIVLLLCNKIGQGQQFLREVKNPSGPSISILRGGGFPRNGNVEDSDLLPLNAGNRGEQNQNEVEQRFQLVDNQGLPLQVADNPQPIPQDGDQSNPFTNGVGGVGLRLQVRPQQIQPTPPSQQQVSHQVQPQHQQPQRTPISQQIPVPLTITVPTLLPGQTYVDQYGRPFVYTEPPQPVRIQSHPNPIIQQQALVDKYGRQLTQIEVQQPVDPVAPATVPVAQEVFHQPAVVSVAEKATAPVLQKVVHPGLTLQTYAVPGVKKVKGLAIPYAQKVVLAASIPEQEVVHHPPVSAHALVKSRHRTILTPFAKQVQVAPQVIHAPVADAAAQPPVYVQEPHYVATAALAHQQQLVHHQQFIQVADHHVLAPAHVEPHHELHVIENQSHAVLPVAAAGVPVHKQHIIQLASSPEVVLPVSQPAPVLVKKVKKIVPVVPDVTLIHQPVLPKALFQQHIFNVKHGSEPIIYQDLCTVYPYQKNLRACVLKKAVLPELHHPDIRTVNVEEQPKVDKSLVTVGSPIVSQSPFRPIGDDSRPSVTIARELPNSIQETIAKQKLAAEAANVVSSTAQPQPEAAESKDSSTSKPRRSKKKGSSRPTSTSTTQKPFILQ